MSHLRSQDDIHHRSQDDRGAATIWIIAVAAIVLMIALVAAMRTQAVLARHRAGVAADLAALAAAGGIGIDPDPTLICARATHIASANGARLTVCSVKLDASGRSGTVDVAVTAGITLVGIGPRNATAHARAARLAPSADEAR